MVGWIGFLNDLFYDRSLNAGPREMSIPFLLDKKPTFVPAARPESGREARERFLREPLGRTPSERRRRLALAGGFALFRSFGIDRIGEPGHGAGHGAVGPDG